MNQSTNHEVRQEADRLLERHHDLMRERPGLRIRDAAQELGVAEGQLVAAGVGQNATRLTDDPEAILRAAETLGEVMALTRNHACVHERKGVYDGPSFSRHGKMAMGLFNNPDIDLRLFMGHWAFCFAVVDEAISGVRRSLQFFDREGVAIHKIYLTEKSDVPAFEALVGQHRSVDQLPSIDVEPYEPKSPDRDDSEIDWSGLRSSWENLRDVHDFFPMLRKYRVGREQAFARIGRDFAYEVENDAARRVLDFARDKSCDIMVFVGNRGCIQIHTGPVEKLVEHGPWYNVLDPKFNLHLNEEAIARTWVTRKPTEDGIVTNVEVFDANGEIIVTFFGRRKPGQPELDRWREIVGEVPAKGISDAA